MTERVSMAFWPVLRIFRAFSKYPTQSGLSDFASVGQDGVQHDQQQFPWCLVLRPSEDLRCHDSSCNFLQQLANVKSGTAIYRVLACDSPRAAAKGEMQQIGTVVTASDF